MFELLLQAEKALADGLLDQAERTYWQLIEIDPTNAIATAGLARISLERGDERLARTFADRAIAIDPENVVAGRVVATLEHRGAERVEAELPDLPLMAAERLEALSRRRSTGPREPAEGGESRAGLHPDLISELPSEPLSDRRQAGRLAASAAAAAAAMPPGHRTATRHEPHRAMPSGNRRFDADELRAPAPDAFAAAESAAAVEAVDAAELAAEAPEGVPGPVSGGADVAEAAEPEAAEPRAADTTEAEAAAADESVALRVALVAEAVEAMEREAAELAAAWARDGELRGTLAVSEADMADQRAHEFAAAEGTAAAEAADAAGDEVADVRAGERGVDEFAAAEAEAAQSAPNDILAAQSAEPDERVELAAQRQPSFGRSAEQPSEEDAETQALREALAIVLGTDGEAGPADPGEAAGAAPPARAQAERPSQSAAQDEPAEPIQPDPQDEPEPSASRHKRSLFRPFRR